MGKDDSETEDADKGEAGVASGGSIEQLLQSLLANQKETNETLKQMKEDACRTREADRKAAEEGRKDLKREIAGLAKKLETACVSWAEEKVTLEERIRTMEKDREDRDEREARARREWEKRMEEKLATVRETEVSRMELGPAQEAEGLESRATQDEKRVRVLESKILDIEQEAEAKEKAIRRNNVIVKGKEIDEAQNKIELAIEALKTAAGREVGTEDVRVIQVRNGFQVQIKIRTWEEKKEVMAGKKKLGSRKIFIEHDLTRKEREIQRKILDKVWSLKRLGYDAKPSYQKMWVGGRRHDWCFRSKSIGKCYDEIISNGVRVGSGNGECPRPQGEVTEPTAAAVAGEVEGQME